MQISSFKMPAELGGQTKLSFFVNPADELCKKTKYVVANSLS